MPRISEFYGIVVYMYWRDHAPPHFHAIYAGEEAQVRIGDGTILAGSLPRTAANLVTEWAQLHRDELGELDPSAGARNARAGPRASVA